MDADILIPPDQIGKILALPRNSRDVAYKVSNPNVHPALIYFCSKFNRIKITGKLKVHPKITLVNRRKYWEIGGCDEDFVRVYGFGDAHFWHRAAKVNTIVDVRKEIFLKAAPEASSKSGTKGLNRDMKINSKKYWRKKQGIMPWSTSFLRFNWTAVEVSGALPG